MRDRLIPDQLFTLSPEQKIITDRLGTVTSIVYHDPKMAVHTIVNSIFRLFADGQKVIIVSANERIRAAIKKLIYSTCLEKFCIEINPDSAFSEINAQSIRAKASESINKKNTTAIRLSRYMWEQKELKIKEQLLLFDKIVFAGFTLKDIIYMHAHKMSNPDSQYLRHKCKNIRLSFTEHEYTALRSAIIQSGRYNSYNDKSNRSVINSKKLYQSLRNQNEYLTLSEEIKTYLTDALQINQQYYQLIQKIENLKFAEFTNLYHSIKDNLNALKFISEILNFQSDGQKKKSSGILSIFKSENNTADYSESVTENLLSEIEIKLSRLGILHEIPSTPNLTTLNLFCDGLLEKIELKRENFKINVQHFLRSLNILNAGESSAINSENLLNELIEKLNASEVFSEKFEVNTISILKQVEITEHIVHTLRKASEQLEYEKGRMEWLQFYEQADHLFHEIYNFLKNINEENRLSAFDGWYFSVLISSHIESVSDEITSNRSSFPSSIFRDMIQGLDIGSVHFTELMQVTTEQLKSNNKQLYSEIFRKKKVSDVSWKYLLEKHCEFISSYFPVLISENDDFKNLPSGQYEHIFYVGYDQFNSEILQNFRTIHTYIMKNSKIIEKSDAVLKLPYLENTPMLSELSLTDRLKTAKKLASILLDIQPEVRFYQAKNLNIVSYLNSFAQKAVLQYLNSAGIKEILQAESTYDQMVESLLETDRRPCLLVEDNLINPKDMSSLNWQYKLLDEMEKAGFRVITLNSRDAAFAGPDYVSDIFMQSGINISLTPTPKSVIQMV